MSDTAPDVETAISRVTATAREFGLSEEDIEAAVDGLIDGGGEYVPVEDGLRQYLAGDPRATEATDLVRTPAEALRGLLAHSPLGIDADAKYWNDMPQIHIEETLGHAGYDAEFTDSDGNTISVLLDNDRDTVIQIAVTDPDPGLTLSTTFEYPDTPLRTNNYPALVHAVNDRLLAPLGVEYVLLNTEGTRWRFALIDSDRLEILRETYGDRLRFPGMDEPLLEDAVPADYLEPPIPTGHTTMSTADPAADELGDALLGDGEQADEPEGVTIPTTPDPTAEDSMTGGVLDLEAINEATAEQEPEGSFDLDSDVESVITEAESMLDGEDIAETIFGSSDDEGKDEYTAPEPKAGAETTEDRDTTGIETTSEGGEPSGAVSEDEPARSASPTTETGDDDETTEEKGAVARARSFLSSLLN